MKTAQEWSEATQFKSYPDCIEAIQEDARAELQAELDTVKAELDRFRLASSDIGYNDGDPVGNIHRYKRYASGELELSRQSNRKLQAYCQKLQELLKPEQFIPIATELMLKPVESLHLTPERAKELRRLANGLETKTSYWTNDMAQVSIDTLNRAARELRHMADVLEQKKPL